MGRKIFVGNLSFDTTSADLEALFTQAASLEQEGKGRDAVKMYTQAARSGNGKAAKRLGEIFA